MQVWAPLPVVQWVHPEAVKPKPPSVAASVALAARLSAVNWAVPPALPLVPGWVAMGVTGSPYGSTADNGSNNAPVANPQTYIDQEVSIANVDTGVVFRVAHHRSTGHYSNAPVNNYWAQTNVTPSPSGTRILVQSDWGNADPKNPVINPNAAVDTYVIELPAYKPN